jgi:hypothetical protein
MSFGSSGKMNSAQVSSSGEKPIQWYVLTLLVFRICLLQEAFTGLLK